MYVEVFVQLQVGQFEQGFVDQVGEGFGEYEEDYLYGYVVCLCLVVDLGFWKEVVEEIGDCVFLWQGDYVGW